VGGAFFYALCIGQVMEPPKEIQTQPLEAAPAGELTVDARAAEAERKTDEAMAKALAAEEGLRQVAQKLADMEQRLVLLEESLRGRRQAD
jgi:hypothetical protein